MTPTVISNASSVMMNSPSNSYTSEYSSSSSHHLRPPLSTTTPTKTNLSTHSEKSKPRPLTKRMGFKRAVMQKFKITKHNR